MVTEAWRNEIWERNVHKDQQFPPCTGIASFGHERRNISRTSGFLAIMSDPTVTVFFCSEFKASRILDLQIFLSAILGVELALT